MLHETIILPYNSDNWCSKIIFSVYKFLKPGGIIIIEDIYKFRKGYEEMKYYCNKCKYRATMHFSPEHYIQSVFEGVKYDCN